VEVEIHRERRRRLEEALAVSAHAAGSSASQLATTQPPRLQHHSHSRPGGVDDGTPPQTPGLGDAQWARQLVLARFAANYGDALSHLLKYSPVLWAFFDTAGADVIDDCRLTSLRRLLPGHRTVAVVDPSDFPRLLCALQDVTVADDSSDCLLLAHGECWVATQRLLHRARLQPRSPPAGLAPATPLSPLWPWDTARDTGAAPSRAVSGQEAAVPQPVDALVVAGAAAGCSRGERPPPPPGLARAPPREDRQREPAGLTRLHASHPSS
jgi:hypothetical protein